MVHGSASEKLDSMHKILQNQFKLSITSSYVSPKTTNQNSNHRLPNQTVNQALELSNGQMTILMKPFH